MVNVNVYKVIMIFQEIVWLVILLVKLVLVQKKLNVLEHVARIEK